MSEILTESFCERCGTRYTFESARPKSRLKGVKVLSRGLKNFVLSDDTTMDEAMAAARSETDREGTAHQLDAFHKTFNFCMSCRQYTCPNCWNEVEARCQSCAPLPELEIAAPEIAPPAFPGLLTLAGPTTTAEPTLHGANGHYHDAVAQPFAQKPTDEPAAKATSQTASLLDRFRPGQSLDDELAAFERDRPDSDLVAVEPSAEAAAEAVADAVADASPELQAETAAQATPETVAAEAPVEAIVEDVAAEAPVDALVEAEPTVEPEPVAAAQVEADSAAPPTADVVEQPTWRVTAPDLEPPAIGTPRRPDESAPLQATAPSVPSAEPQWPPRPEWPAPQASAGLPFLGRPAQPQGGVDSLWAASNRELVATPPTAGKSTSGIQPCINCGLSLSANARFCRRCGTLQGG